MLAQRQVSKWVPVFDQIGAVLSGKHVEALPDTSLIKPPDILRQQWPAHGDGNREAP
jgi:hypothetical protein